MKLSDLPPGVRAMFAKLDQDRADSSRSAEDARQKFEAAKRLQARRVAYLVARGLPKPETEHRFHPNRQWRFDFAWPAAKIALEVEGATFAGKPCPHCGQRKGGRHNSGTGFRADIEKYNAAAALGWRVLRCEPKQLDRGEIVAVLLEAMG